MRQTLHLDAGVSADLKRAATILRGGGLVAFPTETVYGLGANALSTEAVAGIFAAKQRPSWDPLIVHLADLAGVPAVARLATKTEHRFRVLAATFWPGPLTLLLPRTTAVPAEVTAGRSSVGVRIPAHPAALALLRETGLPLAAPSANRFGHTSPTTAQHVLDDLEGRIDAVLDGGPCAVGVESTVLDPGPTPMLIYRAGAVTVRDLGEIGLEARLFELPAGVDLGPAAALPSPGVGIRHYAPRIPVHLTGPDETSVGVAVQRARADGLRVGVLLPRGWSEPFEGDGVRVERWGRWEDPASLASGLFAGIRALERAAIDCIVCPLPERGDVRDALRDRLTKAARTE